MSSNKSRNAITEELWPNEENKCRTGSTVKSIMRRSRAAPGQGAARQGGLAEEVATLAHPDGHLRLGARPVALIPDPQGAAGRALNRRTGTTGKDGGSRR